MPRGPWAIHSRLGALLLGLGLASTLGGAGCAAGGEAGYLRRGETLAEAGRWDEARTELRLAVTVEPREARARLLLAKVELASGRPGAALRELEVAERLGVAEAGPERRKLLDAQGALRAEARRPRPAAPVLAQASAATTARPARSLGQGFDRLPPPCGAPDPAGRRRLHQALRGDLALVERLAQDYVDGAASAYCRGFEVVALFSEIGDPARALAWAERLVAEDETDPVTLSRAVAAAARAHDGPRALLYLEQAEFVSKVRGRASLEAVRAFLEAGLTVEALHAGRQALALATGVDRDAAHELTVVAMLSAGRTDDGQHLFAIYGAKLDPAQRDAARARIRGELPRGPQAPTWAWLAPERPVAPDVALASSPEPQAVVDGKVGVDELLGVGLSDDGPRGIEALEAYARLADAEGRRDDARRARAEVLILRTAGAISDGAERTRSSASAARPLGTPAP